MVTQQEKKMLWEYFGKGSGVEVAMSQQEGFRSYLLDETRGLSLETAGIVRPESECQFISRSSVLPTLTKVTGAKK